MLDTIFYIVPEFFDWLSTTYITPNVSLMTFIVSCFLISVVIYLLFPYSDDD